MKRCNLLVIVVDANTCSLLKIFAALASSCVLYQEIQFTTAIRTGECVFIEIQVSHTTRCSLLQLSGQVSVYLVLIAYAAEVNTELSVRAE